VVFQTGTGGLGGGGQGAITTTTAGGNGTANLGGGGGGGRGASGGNGGSGIVIISYPDTFSDAASTTGSPTFTNTGGNKIYKFTGSGSITF
jgi:mucin-19